ncbi:hypothetical protein [Streptomyces shenzhenensis]|uniref:hypothetical protein n=1 Tax=Streptomyces TaxID=1883 RepID=UPI001F46B899|nr:hypothetical protein [Streptomyces shenzhenensis]
MAHPRSSRGEALAVPVVLPLTAPLGLLPTVASAAPSATRVTPAADGDGVVDAVRAGGRRANDFYGSMSSTRSARSSDHRPASRY